MIPTPLYLGTLAVLTGVGDTPSDEGGWVRLSLTAAPADPGPGPPEITGYNVWRLVSGGQVSAILESESMESALDALEGSPRVGARLSRAAALAAGLPAGTWESIGFHAALQLPSYVLSAPTRNDSGPLGHDDETYVVTVHTTSPSEYGVTLTAVGHSVDNLPPAQPQPFVAVYSESGVALHWSANRESDLAGYRLYRDTRRYFAPGPENLLSAQPDTGFVDLAGGSVHIYKLAAVDVHGNQGPNSVVTFDGPVATLASLFDVRLDGTGVRVRWMAAASPGMAATVYRRTVSTGWSDRGRISADGTGLMSYADATVEPGTSYGYRLGIMDGAAEMFVGEAWVDVPVLQLAMRGAIPNPTTGGRLWVEFALRDGSPAKLVLADVAGRVLSARQVGTLGAGTHALDLSGGRALAPGIYFLRLTQGGTDIRTRAAVIR